MSYDPLENFKALLVQVDPKATHYKSMQQENYTVWAEYGTIALRGNDTTSERVYKVQVDRFTKAENDSVAAAITAMLDEQCVGYEYLVDYEQDTGYIHHIWDCKVD